MPALSRKEALIESLGESPSVTRPELRERMSAHGYSPNDTSKAIYDLRAEGRVSSTREGGEMVYTLLPGTQDVPDEVEELAEAAEKAPAPQSDDGPAPVTAQRIAHEIVLRVGVLQMMAEEPVTIDDADGKLAVLAQLSEVLSADLSGIIQQISNDIRRVTGRDSDG